MRLRDITKDTLNWSAGPLMQSWYYHVVGEYLNEEPFEGHTYAIARPYINSENM